MVEEEITWTRGGRRRAARQHPQGPPPHARHAGGLTVVALVIAVLAGRRLVDHDPAGVMLGAFVLLLREAAKSDAERARRLAQAAEARDAARSAPRPGSSARRSR